jgi:lysophospholipase L1-like esterase
VLTTVHEPMGIAHRYSGGRRALLGGMLAAALCACEGTDAHVSGPKGGSAFVHYVAIGTSLTMGVQSAGVLYNSQVEAWPSLLARAAGADFSVPLLRSPGCTPPVIAPLQLARFLSGASTLMADTSCAGVLGAAAPPLNNVALAGATAWAALNLTPKLVAAAPALYDAGDRGRYPAVLAPTQSQVTAMAVQGASFVSVELGFAELIRAATSGLVVAATSYTQTAPFTYVPAALFAPVYAAISDSVKRSGARVVLLTVPHVTRLNAMRLGSELWNARADLATFGVNVADDCNGSANFVFTGTLIPMLTLNALTADSAQILSCADLPGAADGVLTPADVVTLDAVVDQMNAQIRQLATRNGWALADLDATFTSFVAGRTSYRASEQLACVYPYGAFISLDGVHPNVSGHQAIARQVAEAVNATYGFAIQVAVPMPPTSASLCP